MQFFSIQIFPNQFFQFKFFNAIFFNANSLMQFFQLFKFVQF